MVTPQSGLDVLDDLLRRPRVLWLRVDHVIESLAYILALTARMAGHDGCVFADNSEHIRRIYPIRRRFAFSLYTGGGVMGK